MNGLKSTVCDVPSLKKSFRLRSSTYASKNYLSTLAVLQLDEILTNARVVSTVKSKDNGNQKPFEKMIIMKYDCVGIGVVKMTVGVRRRIHEKVQYCITALEI